MQSGRLDYQPVSLAALDELHSRVRDLTLKGDLAGMPSAAKDSKRSPDTGDLMVQIKLVAGACNQRYFQL